MANVLFVTWDGGGNLPQPLGMPPSCNGAAMPYGSSGMSSSATPSKKRGCGSSRTQTSTGFPPQRRRVGFAG
jgi:hypothetical protein